MIFDGVLPYQLWLKLPKEIRDKLVVLFHIKRTGSTVVDYGAAGNTVVSDGYKPTDIEVITLEKMQVLLDSDSTNFFELLEQVIAQIDALLTPPIQFYDDKVGSIDVKDLLPVDNKETVVKLPFCDSCTSKGGRHLKTCPKR